MIEASRSRDDRGLPALDAPTPADGISNRSAVQSTKPFPDCKTFPRRRWTRLHPGSATVRSDATVIFDSLRRFAVENHLATGNLNP